METNTVTALIKSMEPFNFLASLINGNCFFVNLEAVTS